MKKAMVLICLLITATSLYANSKDVVESLEIFRADYDQTQRGRQIKAVFFLIVFGGWFAYSKLKKGKKK